MNEFQSSERLSELEILRRAEPTWKLANTEPFIRSAQQDVTPPDWDKSGFLNTNGSLQGQGGGGGGQGGLVTFIAGEQQADGSFVIKLITTSGTSANPP